MTKRVLVTGIFTSLVDLDEFEDDLPEDVLSSVTTSVKEDPFGWLSDADTLDITAEFVE